MMRLLILCLGLITLIPNGLYAKEIQDSISSTADKIIVLVRHAEKSASTSKDPSLSPKGELRAKSLLSTLEKTRLSGLIATPFKRTQETLHPMSEQRKLPVTIIDINSGITAHIDATVKTIQAQAGNVLVAGHSNTLPLIISALGGPEIDSIDEDEYSNMYILSMSETNKVELSHASYGQQ
ncbi:histidine phosphatase family protein [Shewanella canadensis]|uniref:Histidine phosphatase family protein n=1 Tax=Shewanella canadensis TaxID=271096 RepID=A0A3S0S0L3_9GAMM|nr:histidine phosphatase family protein [Shewanella canadensis]RTR40842.1 histidine phosphatase family protein [Shewanella canadensis]